jgi:CheY-like chemotaxis protein
VRPGRRAEPAEKAPQRCDAEAAARSDEKDDVVKTILVVDDDEGLRIVIRVVLTSIRCDVPEARSGNDAAVVYALHQPDLVITDIIMPDGDGLQPITDLSGLYKQFRC